jgi:hypothetical protein
MRKIVEGRKEELEQVIKTLDRDKKIVEELKQIHNYGITIETRLTEIRKAVIQEKDD